MCNTKQSNTKQFFCGSRQQNPQSNNFLLLSDYHKKYFKKTKYFLYFSILPYCNRPKIPSLPCRYFQDLCALLHPLLSSLTNTCLPQESKAHIYCLALRFLRIYKTKRLLPSSTIGGKSGKTIFVFIPNLSHSLTSFGTPRLCL